MSDSEPQPTQPRRPPAGEAFLIGLLSLLVLGGLGWWLTRSTGPRVTRVDTAARPERPGDLFLGPQACRDCHVGIYSQFVKSGHSRTLRRAGERELAEWLVARAVEDPELPEVRWSYRKEGDRLIAVREEGENRQELPVEYAIGSGHHATTFTSMLNTSIENPTLREHRLTYFASFDGLGITPGQKADNPSPGTGPLGREVSGGSAYLCFACHTTFTSADDLTKLDVRTMMPNVTCERCHGPGYDHVRAVERESTNVSMPFGHEAGRNGWTAETQIRMCGACHRLPSMLDSEHIRTDDPDLARFQPVGLLQSACYKGSPGKLHCLTCHDPHQTVSTSTTQYERVCLDCHGKSNGQTVCAVSSSDGCIGCHMPIRDTGNGTRFADHWIRVVEPLPARPGG